MPGTLGTTNPARMSKTPLSDNEIAHALQGLPAWRRDGARLTRTLRTPDYMAGVDLVRRVALTAQAQDHHPDLLLGYATLTLTLWSHDAGGITQRDVDLARALDPILDAVAQ